MHPSRPILESTSSILAMALIALLALSGCGGNPRPAPQPELAGLPSWVQDPTEGGKVLGAYGSSGRSHAGFNFKRDIAMQRGRAELARQIEARIQVAITDWTREGGEITNQEDRRTVLASQEAVGRSVSNQVMAGSYQRYIHHDKVSDELFIYVTLSTKMQADLPETVANQVRASLKDAGSNLGAAGESDKALLALDKLVRAQFPEPAPDSAASAKP